MSSEAVVYRVPARGFLRDLIDMADLWINIAPKCHQEGDCLIYSGMVDAYGVPLVRVRGERRPKPLKRVLLEMRGHVFQAGELATSKCGNQACIADKHVIPATRRAVVKAAVKATQYHLNPVRNARISAKKRPTGKLADPEVRAAILASDEHQDVLAARYGCAQATISDFKLGKSYRTYGSPFGGLLR